MKLLAPVLVVVLLLFLPLKARAAAISVIGGNTLPRTDRNGNTIQKRAISENPEAISARDCVEDQRVRAVLQLADFEPTAHLEAWGSVAGMDCSSEASRSGPNAFCWKIFGSIPLASVATIDVPVRMLVGGVAVREGFDGAIDDQRVCTRVESTKVSVQFLYFRADFPATPVSKTEAVVAVDTVGDPPPSALVVYPGYARVEVEWQDPNALTRSWAVRVYCARIDPAVQGGACASPLLPAGLRPNEATDAMRCGAARRLVYRLKVGATGDGQPLENGAAYAFALATVDQVGNVGPLSESVCESPQPGAALPDEPAPGEGGCTISRSDSVLDGLFGVSALALLVMLRGVGAWRDRRERP